MGDHHRILDLFWQHAHLESIRKSVISFTLFWVVVPHGPNRHGTKDVPCRFGSELGKYNIGLHFGNGRAGKREIEATVRSGLGLSLMDGLLLVYCRNCIVGDGLWLPHEEEELSTWLGSFSIGAGISIAFLQRMRRQKELCGRERN